MWFLILLLMQYPEVQNIKYWHKEMERELAIDPHQSLS
jgi:L-ribulose-5-phosphate 3-epimerase UlaE